MGGNTSEAHLSYFQTPAAFTYSPVVGSRRETDKSYPEKTPSKPQSSAALLKTAYHGTWTMDFPHSVCPVTRIGQSFVFDPLTNSLIIAYGCDARGNELNDAWSLSFNPLQWRLISSNLLGPRQRASATLVGRKMIIFGGHRARKFLSELHTIDLDTGLVEIISEDPYGPSPRVMPVFVNYHNLLLLWSGFDGTSHGESYLFDLISKKWTKDPSETTGRNAPAYCVHQGVPYVFGSTRGHGLMKKTEKGTWETLPCSGAEPPAELTHAALVGADEYLFLIGGEADFDYMHIFAFEIKRNWWFAFHVRPDELSLSLSDGIVNKIGLFMMPREHSASVVYSAKNRNLISVMGSKMLDPAPVFQLKIGEALGSLHMRSDMIEIFNQMVRNGNSVLYPDVE